MNMLNFLENTVLPMSRVIDANGYFEILLLCLLPVMLIGSVILFKKGAL
jgi:hypothetical protein